MAAAALPNFHEVSSPEHFQNLLSEDLNRVSLINFWAPWAEPCKQMNEVVIELAKKYTQVLVLQVRPRDPGFLRRVPIHPVTNRDRSARVCRDLHRALTQVEAEDQGDIAESFDIEAVPAFVILRVRIPLPLLPPSPNLTAASLVSVLVFMLQGHTLLSRISGADAPALTQELAKHTQPPSSIKPQSTTDRTPAAPAEAETAEQLTARLRKLMTQADVVLFMKGSPDTPRCGFSRRIVGLLKNEHVAFSHFDILQDESVRQGLKVLNDWPTFPQLIVKGEFVGGLDVVQEMVENGELKTLLA